MAALASGEREGSASAIDHLRLAGGDKIGRNAFERLGEQVALCLIEAVQHIFEQCLHIAAQPGDNATALVGEVEDARPAIGRVGLTLDPSGIFQPVDDTCEGDGLDLKPLGIEGLIFGRIAFKREQQPRLRSSQTEPAHPLVEEAAKLTRVISESVSGLNDHACTYNKPTYYIQGCWRPEAKHASRPIMTFVTEQFASFDGTRLAFHTEGEGRPVILLHGLFSSAQMNWIKWGHGARLAASGFRAIMLDFRVHGESEAPRDPAAYPPGVLVRDVVALAGYLALEPGEFDLVGFSLGARTAIHAVAHGILEPRRLAICGMGVAGLSGWARRADHFKRVIDEFDTIKPGDPAYTARTFLKSQGVDRVAARLLLDAMDDFDLAKLANLTMPTAVICGDEDQDNGSAPDLAALLPDARYVEVPGTHMNSVTKPELGEAIAAFLAA